MQELELAIHSHQNLYEQVTTAYTEVRAHTARMKGIPKARFIVKP